MSCHHNWFGDKTEPVQVDGGVATRYYHTCGKCGKKKITVRMSRVLPPSIKWTRELEKLLIRAGAAGSAYHYDGVPLDLTKVTIHEA